jgi:2-haloacid dehalogenase
MNQYASISFDCYGTLIDWESGIRDALQQLSADPPAAIDQQGLFDLYLETEARIEGGPYQSYRQILTDVQAALLKEFSLPTDPARARLLADSQANWQPFPDTVEALARLTPKFQLIILSNIDRDMFAQSARWLEVPFDRIITAQDVGAYKPAEPHFRRLAECVDLAAGTHLHVAQSVFHDGMPARRFGIPFVWINRRAEQNTTSAQPLAVFQNLTQLADWLEA